MYGSFLDDGCQQDLNGSQASGGRAYLRRHVVEIAVPSQIMIRICISTSSNIRLAM